MKRIVLISIAVLIPFLLKAQTHSMKVTVEIFDNVMLDNRAEVWIKGMGSWYLNNDYSDYQINEHKLVSKKTPKLETNKTYTLYFYPNSRDGKEISANFEIDPDFCKQGCIADDISITVYSNRIKIHGRPIKKYYDKIELEKDW